MGELEFKIEKRPKSILFFKISIDQDKNTLKSLRDDFKLQLDHTQIVQHFSGGIGAVFDFQLEDAQGGIDLDKIVDRIFSEGKVTTGNGFKRGNVWDD